MKKYDIKGEEVEMGTIGDFADAMGRTSQAIRKWEERTIIPPTRFRDEANRRLYPKKLIDRVQEIAEEESITQGVSFKSTNFKERTHEAFKEVEKEILED